MKSLFLLALLSVLCIHANSQNKPSILIGTGGGITGVNTVYHVTPSGEVFKGKGISAIKYTECGKISRGKAKKMIAKVITAVNGSTFDHPGNIYYFLSLKENDGGKKVTWGHADHTVPDTIKTLFDEINTTITNLKYKPIPENN